MKANESYFAFNTFHLFLRIGTFQWVTFEKNIKNCPAFYSPLRLSPKIGFWNTSLRLSRLDRRRRRLFSSTEIDTKISGFGNILGSMIGPALSYVTPLRSVSDGTIRSGFFGRFQRAARKSGALRSALRFILRRGVLAPNEIRTVAGAPRTARPRFRDVIALTLELKKS
jgi:hypothetical protein